jgi:hypothetical protein
VPVAHNLIVRNVMSSSHGSGAGILGANLTQLQIVNNTLLWNRNKGKPGAALTLAEAWGNVSDALVANNLIAFNSSGVSGTATLLFRNNCVYGNGSSNFAGMTDPTGTEGNISEDPRITDRNLFAGPGNHHLLPGSPCIGAGDVSVVQVGDVDMDGDTRLDDGAVDIGADEFVIHPFTIQSEVLPGTSAIRLTLVGQPGVAYTWERSTNLRDWSTVKTQATREGVAITEERIDDPIATYRAVSQ